MSGFGWKQFSQIPPAGNAQQSYRQSWPVGNIPAINPNTNPGVGPRMYSNARMLVPTTLQQSNVVIGFNSQFRYPQPQPVMYGYQVCTVIVLMFDCASELRLVDFSIKLR